MEDLLQEHENLKKIIYEMKMRNELKQIMIAMNDISIIYSLEEKTNNIYFNYLKEDCKVYNHYIDRLTDSGVIFNAKVKLFYKKIMNIHDNIYKKINEIYPNIIIDIITELNQLIPQMKIFLSIKDEEYMIKRIELWWN